MNVRGKGTGLGTVTVIAVGAALVVLYIGAGVTLAIGHVLPTEFWAAASSLSGALVGLLAPQPATKGALERHASQLNMSIANAPAANRTALAADATRAKAAADESTTRYDARVLGLAAVGVVAFGLGILFAFKVGHHTASHTTAYDTAVKNVADTLIALGSGAAGALIGLLAPSPTNPSADPAPSEHPQAAADSRPPTRGGARGAQRAPRSPAGAAGDIPT